MHTINLPDSLALSLAVAAVITPEAKAFVGCQKPWLSMIPSFAAPPVCGSIRGSVDRSSRRIGVFPCAIRSYRQTQKRTRLLAGDEAPRRPDGLDPKDLEWMPEGMRNCIMFPPKTVAELEEDERKAALAWKDDGRKGRVLIRRREVPLPERDPVSVCQLVMECLNLNDDPMLNYGAAVTIKHASSRNPMRNMTPKELGDFLQNDPDMVMLLANSDCRPAERAKISADGTRVLQKVKLVGSEMMQDDGWVKYGGGMERTVDVHLVKEDGCWMIDAFDFVPWEDSRADLVR